jgi:hypothetical protein
MKSELAKLTFIVELEEGEKLTIPDSISQDIGYMMTAKAGEFWVLKLALFQDNARNIAII